MLRRTILLLVTFSFFFTKKVFAGESGGMPQLNPEFWVSQIFWLTLTFGFLYIILSKFILPKISDNLESRKLRISDNIEAAEKQRVQSETKLKEYEEIISESKIEAKNIFNQTREKALRDIDSKRELLDRQIKEEIKKAEDEIDQLKKDAPTKINQIAIETASLLTQKLIGTEVNRSNLSAIIDDLSKKKGDEYYGN